LTKIIIFNHNFDYRSKFRFYFWLKFPFLNTVCLGLKMLNSFPFAHFKLSSGCHSCCNNCCKSTKTCVSKIFRINVLNVTIVRRIRAKFSCSSFNLFRITIFAKSAGSFDVVDQIPKSIFCISHSTSMFTRAIIRISGRTFKYKVFSVFWLPKCGVLYHEQWFWLTQL